LQSAEQRAHLRSSVTRPSWTIRLLDRSSGSASPLQSKPLTSAQLRAARSLIRWSAEDLARETALSVATIRRALEAAGVEFIDENGGGPGLRLRKRQRAKPAK